MHQKDEPFLTNGRFKPEPTVLAKVNALTYPEAFVLAPLQQYRSAGQGQTKPEMFG